MYFRQSAMKNNQTWIVFDIQNLTVWQIIEAHWLLDQSRMGFKLRLSFEAYSPGNFEERKLFLNFTNHLICWQTWYYRFKNSFQNCYRIAKNVFLELILSKNLLLPRFLSYNFQTFINSNLMSSGRAFTIKPLIFVFFSFSKMLPLIFGNP
jgi:hypothetical protein